ncbi:hypothetical protein [Desulfosporosinus sp. Sb-LF]|uniref:hypothetical protein n=1 Tax=Desulfosporosinus sp. Sb-LF TaxID=2560027 RepID=UPI00107EEBE4|nr:hypothetical protein [Desulfosporosinus sp. Sb-LF]TGE31961.1 hypothetical protein E4K68_14845 [Desulfosporosinus sp. Sb-LF]
MVDAVVLPLLSAVSVAIIAVAILILIALGVIFITIGYKEFLALKETVMLYVKCIDPVRFTNVFKCNLNYWEKFHIEIINE